jgi:hypothetical protein
MKAAQPRSRRAARPLVPAALVSLDVDVLALLPVLLASVEPEVEGVAVELVPEPAVEGVAVELPLVAGVLIVPEPLVVLLVEPAAGAAVEPGGAVVPGGVSVPGATLPVPVLPVVDCPVPVPDWAKTKPAAAARVSAATTRLLRGVLIWKSPVAER